MVLIPLQPMPKLWTFDPLWIVVYSVDLNIESIMRSKFKLALKWTKDNEFITVKNYYDNMKNFKKALDQIFYEYKILEEKIIIPEDETVRIKLTWVQA